ncbi:MAG TPA: DUF167 domain-containing protein [Longimicrobiales bacterium]
MAIRVEQRGAVVRLSIRVQPRASRSEVVGEHDGALKLRLAAPPVEGEANRELVRFLGKLLGVAPSRVTVVSGATGKSKVVEIGGVAVADVERALGV